ncbi:HSP20-like chaperone [Melanomma pulvis-pyrius CBS 109.77]|uniref:HSP20-like chaperone n=1 Tax=Melanomma pulvis-pyrius CBS 109.77 TaxID=1314802 RepID=A0A6A6XLQ9_9PLEO|nr:HSP20-like chaperone [Melanomma pulvis-pyrius CBS 109.77]
MAFFLTPRFAPTTQHCGPFACGPSRAIYRQPAPAPAAAHSFVPFLSQVEELFGELDREARRVAHAQRQQRKRIFRARFDVRENGSGYEVEGELPGFEQENISIEVTDEHTLKVAGKQTQAKAATPPATLQETTVAEALTHQMEGATLAEQDSHSDSESQKSYQPTVEDDYEDLGAETSSTVSAALSEPTGKDKTVRAPVQQQAPALQPQQSQQQQQQQPENQDLLTERIHGSFERNFRFPDRIDAAAVRASLRNGVLSINVPKAPVPAVRNIAIQ